MRINNNTSATSAYNALNVANGNLSKSIERLSTGFRINRAADDASGLVISEQLRSTIGGSKVAIRNAQDGIGVVQTMDGALAEVTSILQRMRDLSLHYNNGATDAKGQAADQAEFDSLAADIDRIASSTSFGATKLLDSTYTGTAATFLVGANGSDSIDITAATTPVVFDATTSTGLTSIVAGAMTLVTDIDLELDKVGVMRGQLGAVQNRFDHVIANLNSTVENLGAAESRIRDTDMSAEMTAFTKNQILSQASTAMLAQANQLPSSVLTLLRG